MRLLDQISDGLMHGLTFAMLLGGIPLVVCLVLPWLWWLLLVASRSRPRGMNQQVLVALVQGVDRTQAPGVACQRLRASLPTPWRRRVERLELDPTAVSWAGLLASGVLPQRLARLAHAAFALGPEAARCWLTTASRLAQIPARGERVARVMMGGMVALGGILIFLWLHILPKFMYLRRELELQSTLLDLAATGSPTSALLVIIPLCLSPMLVWFILERWRWRAVDGHLRLHLVAEAVRLGRNEAALAKALHVACPRQSASLEKAGSAGDLARVTAAVGLGPITMGQLGHAVMVSERRVQRRTRIMAALIEMVLPMLTALVVGVVVTDLWRIMTSLMVGIHAQMENAPW